jgi:hypothetical protein
MKVADVSSLAYAKQMLQKHFFVRFSMKHQNYLCIFKVRPSKTQSLQEWPICPRKASAADKNELMLTSQGRQ